MEGSGLHRLIVRIMEMLLCSIIPSSICLFILTRLPSSELWVALCCVAFVLCALANGFFWYWDNVSVGHNARSYFVINIIAYLVFAAAAYVVYRFTSGVIYSAGFASLRSFEQVFSLRKIRSINITHVVLLAEMTAVYFLGHLHFIKHNVPEIDIDALPEDDEQIANEEYTYYDEEANEEYGGEYDDEDDEYWNGQY